MASSFRVSRRQFLSLGGTVALAGSVGACGGSDNPVTIDTSLPNSSFGAESTAEEVTASGMATAGAYVVETRRANPDAYDALLRTRATPWGVEPLVRWSWKLFNGNQRPERVPGN